MPKEKNADAIKLIGSPEKLINRMVKNTDERTWILDKITVEGPPHKQIQHTLVLTRIEHLLALRKKSGKATLLPCKDGIEITSHDHEKLLPVKIPAQSLDGLQDKDKIIDMLSKGPEHEILYTTLLLQIIESLILSE